MLRINRDIESQRGTAERPASLTQRAVEWVKRAHSRRSREEFWQDLRRMALAAR